MRTSAARAVPALYEEGAGSTCRAVAPLNTLRVESAPRCYTASAVMQDNECRALNDLDDLHRKYARVADLRFFDPAQRIWWLYLREAAEKWLERNEDADVRAAYDRLKEFPEHLPNERARWIELRDAVANVVKGSSATEKAASDN